MEKSEKELRLGIRAIRNALIEGSKEEESYIEKEKDQEKKSYYRGRGELARVVVEWIDSITEE